MSIDPASLAKQLHAEGFHYLPTQPGDLKESALLPQLLRDSEMTDPGFQQQVGRELEILWRQKELKK